MDNLIGSIASIVILGAVPFAAFYSSRIVDRFTK